MADRIDFTTPVGRLVGGSLYDPVTTDYDGKPLVVKNGPNAGQARVDFTFGLAIPKAAGQSHWAQRPVDWPPNKPYWGEEIWKLAHAAFPQGEAQRPDFAWKIIDGDSTIPNRKMRKPCDREGYPGHWVMWFSGGYAPRVFNADGSQQIMEKDAVKPGYYVQVFGNVSDNKPSASPGLYINHSLVALAAYGPEIISGPDVSAAGFGQGVALPPGATTAPVAGAFNPAPPVPGAPPLPGAHMQPYQPAVGAPPAPPAPPVQVPVQPYPAILNPGAPPAPPVAAPAYALPAAQGATYEQLIEKGWTDALLVAHGMMQP